MKKKNLLQRVIIIAVVTLVGLYLVIGPRRRPTLKDFTWSGIKATLAPNIHLGLDLQGGSHLVMRVKTEEFLKRLTEENCRRRSNCRQGCGISKSRRSRRHRIRQLSRRSRTRRSIQGHRNQRGSREEGRTWLTLLHGPYSASGNQISWTMTPTAERVLADNATTQALNIIDSRINAARCH